MAMHPMKSFQSRSVLQRRLALAPQKAGVLNFWIVVLGCFAIRLLDAHVVVCGESLYNYDFSVLFIPATPLTQGFKLGDAIRA